MYTYEKYLYTLEPLGQFYLLYIQCIRIQYALCIHNTTLNKDYDF